MENVKKNEGVFVQIDSAEELQNLNGGFSIKVQIVDALEWISDRIAKEK